MTNHPLNLVLRIALELFALGILVAWPLSVLDSTSAIVLAILLPIGTATVWGVFRVPGDPGMAPVPIPGWLRLLIEVGIFIITAWMLFDAGWIILCRLYIILFVFHYAISYERIGWLVRGK